MTHVIDDLYKTVLSKKDQSPDQSYTAQLFDKGIGKISQKVGEEAVEAVVASCQNNREELICESADLLYHLLVLWAALDVKPDDVYAELGKRTGQGGLEEKANRMKT